MTNNKTALLAVLLLGGIAASANPALAGTVSPQAYTNPYRSVNLGGANRFLSGQSYASPYKSINLGGANRFLSGR